MTAPRVSVLLPARDAATTLPLCLRSIERQTEPHWECIVVDDASRDETREVAERSAARDSRFRVVAGEGAGLVAALLRGFEHCRAPLIARMDADDWMHRDRLRAQCAALEAAPELAGVGCHVRLFPRNGLREGRRTYESWLRSLRTPEDVRRDAFVECPLAHPTWLLRREVLEAHPYRECDWPEDYDLLLRLLGSGQNLGVVPRRLLGWRDSPARLSRVHPNYADDRFTACKAEYLAAGFLANLDRYVLWGYGGTGRALRRELAERGREPSHIVELHPGRLGQRIHGAPVIPPQALREIDCPRIVVSVAGAGPRSEIRAALARMGFRELQDYICAA
jgi:glycosyltransferase involved in cell wall biosynthesis